MSTDIDDGRNDDGGTMKTDVRVPTAMVNAIDEEFARRRCISRLEAIRDALRDWLDPSVQLSEETLVDLQGGWTQRRAGEMISLDDALDGYGADVDNDQAWVTNVKITPKADSYWPVSIPKHEGGSWRNLPKPGGRSTTESDTSLDGLTTNYALVTIGRY